MRRLARFLSLAFLILMIGVQGAFAGATLCREESGEVSLEWASDDGCQPGPNTEAVHCLKDGAQAAADHCLQCIDVPLPSEQSAKSLTFVVPFALPLVVCVLSESPAFAEGFDVSFPRAAVAFDGARTVRLLI